MDNITKIKILHIQETIASGGVERIRLSLAKLLDKNLFEQKIICTHAKGNIKDEIIAEGVEIIEVGSLKSLLNWNQHNTVQQIIASYKPDIIHGAVFEGVTMAAINGWLKNVPVVIIEETSDPKYRSWKGNLLMKVFAKISHAVIGVSPAVTKEYLLGKLSLPADKVILINNGVEKPRQVSAEEIQKEKDKWGIKPGDFIVGSIGRMKSDKIKRYSDLIKAFALFAKGKNNCKLLLVGGNDEYLEKYKLLADELGIKDNVIFAGYQSDVILFYNLMNVFSLVSAYEAFGLVLAEAMLSKLPVIATRVGGMKYIVDDKETGFIVELYNVEEIKEKIEILYQQPTLRKEMGIKGYKKAMEEYTEEIYVENIKTLYSNLLRKKTKSI